MAISPVWFYVPNLIGYSRVIFAFLAFYFILENYFLFFFFYALSAVLDMADGHAARKFNQCTKFGAVLDMVTDRATTTCLIVVLAKLYPDYLFHFISLIALDIVSHFAHVYSSLQSGKTSHKTTDPNQNFFVRLYYSNKYVLGFLCFGNEGFFLNLYLSHFWKGPLVALPSPLLDWLSALGLGNGTGLHLIPLLLVFFYFPTMAIKQFMNVVQLKQACEDLVEMDSPRKKNE
eukprot:TRINITY_DN12760_c0_g1_i1.p1 TRINITY_DN12760_c0_g1~~TRINITY_DN12760_c0_g1_i1.p1  ORF type:complete len:232 (-),score=38.71 TRINITY_DN12760_c0_g1_i1:40-735(-)